MRFISTTYLSSFFTCFSIMFYHNMNTLWTQEREVITRCEERIGEISLQDNTLYIHSRPLHDPHENEHCYQYYIYSDMIAWKAVFLIYLSYALQYRVYVNRLITLLPSLVPPLPLYQFNYYKLSSLSFFLYHI